MNTYVHGHNLKLLLSAKQYITVPHELRMHRTALILLVLCIAVPARAEDDCATLAAKHDAADSSVCVDFNYDTDTCITEQDRLRQRLSQQCRDSRPRARGQRFDLTIVVPTTNRNATYLRDTLQSLWADLGPCDSGSRVHVAVYNTGDHRNRPFFDMERAAGDRIACTSFVRWFHQYKQPFPEVPYIAEGGPLWNRRRDIPDSEQVEQTCAIDLPLAALRRAARVTCPARPAHAGLTTSPCCATRPGTSPPAPSCWWKTTSAPALAP